MRHSIHHLFVIQLLAILCSVTTGLAALPESERVDSQPLLLLTQRLTEALLAVGAPLSAEAVAGLAALQQETDEAKITSETQRLLDPLCVAGVEIAPDGALKVTEGQAVEIEENGWKTMLVKVVNRAGVQTRLRMESPNARPIPHGPMDDVANRWLSLTPYDGRPLDENLSGLGLEYRAVQLSSTTVGERKARLEFNAGAAGAKDSPGFRRLGQFK